MKKNRVFQAIMMAAVVLTGMTFAGCSKEEGYRNIQVYEVNGSATIERENVGSIDAYENLNLLSGDWLSVAEESYMRLKMDEDKYLFIEEESELNIIATGSEKDAKTNIQLEKGAVTIEVQNKLAEGASFEVTTPNSVMAIRGTVVRITVSEDEKGEPITIISVLEGFASVQKTDENGNASEEQVLDYGEEAIIYNKEGDIIIVISNEISLSEIPEEVLEFLIEIAEQGRELSASLEEIQRMLQEKKADSTEFPSEEDDTKIGNSEENNSEENNSEENNSEENNSEENNSEENNSERRSKQPGNTEVSSENNEEEEEYNNGWPSASETGKPNIEKPETEKQETETPGAEKEQQTFTVTFKYDGVVFGTQTVEEGQKAVEPILRPAQTGGWDFDFNTAITADTVIEYKE